MALMNRSETRDHGNNSRDHHHHGNSNTNHLGVGKNSSKISKAMSKRNPIQPPKQQPPVYNIDKNDFRNTVQRLTGSPASSEQPSPPQSAAAAANKPQSNSRLQKIRPPPLSFATNGPVNPVPVQASLPTSSSVQRLSDGGGPSPSANALMMSMNPFASGSPTFFSPLPPLTPGDEVWANVSESPINTVSVRNLPKAIMNSGANNSNNVMQQDFASAASIAMNAWADQTPYNANRTSQWNPSPHKSLPRPNPNPLAPTSAQFPQFYSSTSAQLPAPTPGSQFTLLTPSPSPASQFPFPSQAGSQFQSPSLQFPPSPGALFPLSPLSSLAGFQSPGSALFPPSPTARFGVPSPRGVAGFGMPNNVKWLTDSPTAGLTSHFSFPDHTPHM